MTPNGPVLPAHNRQDRHPGPYPDHPKETHMTLTVADLQARLASLPPDMPVVLIKEDAGDTGSPLATAGTALCDASTDFTGDWYATPEQRAQVDDPDEYPKAPQSAVPALFLWPAW